MNSPHLLSYKQVRDMTLKNRIVLAPLTRSRAGTERMPNDLMAEYYAQRASAGLIITEATVISKQGIGWLNTPGIYSDEQVEGWKKITSAVHEKDTPIFVQLWHCGRASHSSFQEGGALPVAPSAIAINGDPIHTPDGKQPHETPRALETEEVKGVVENFRQGAVRAKAAGFDGVEIHGANGYLIDTFLQSKTNHRTDEYGGNLENRFRFLKEIIEAVLTVFPKERISVRLSPNGVYNDMGSPDFRETFLYTTEQLNKYEIGYLHLLDGLGFGFHGLGEPMTLKEFRPVFNYPIIGNCGYTQETAEAAIKDGLADFIAFGRDYISNPDLPERFAHGWPLNPPAEMKDWYSFGPEGYTDFPAYSA
ncbi:MAG: N-ethylmaleimide reductase [Chroococcopsis gigantea SAG 12.99]|jgi:N-ethylmaleimide reductase|nr:N-ethylmaleimide reductase [Chroococcopsis gigantea SAG 12.99]